MNTKTFIYILLFALLGLLSCQRENKQQETSKNNCKQVVLTGKITKDFLSNDNTFQSPDSCLFYCHNYNNQDLVFYSGSFQGEGNITILYTLKGDTAHDILYHPGILTNYQITNNQLIYNIKAEDCCAGINIKEHTFSLNPQLQSTRLHSICSIKGTYIPKATNKQEFTVQQDTLVLRLTPAYKAIFNYELDTDDNTIALFPKDSKGCILADSIDTQNNELWHFVEITSAPIANTHYWYYENNDTTNTSYLGWISSNIDSVIVKYDSFSELRFRSVPITEYLYYQSEYNTTITDKRIIAAIITELEHVKTNAVVCSPCNIDTRMQISVLSHNIQKDVYLDAFHLVEADNCYNLSHHSLKKIVGIIDQKLLNDLFFED